jgi:hypothetical protein
MKRKKSKKQDKRTLASVVKEMAQPRFAKSARTREEKACFAKKPAALPLTLL